MEVTEAQEEWELCKENVQPLRNGRKFANLSMALQPNSGDQLDKLKQGVQEFEAELRTYSGDDPLDVWIRYIKWTEQNFPKGGKESNLSQILAQCVSKFKDEEKYQNDVRYLEVWIKFAMQCSEPLEIFSFLFNQKLGSKLAEFYIAWAWELEQVGNYKKADMILNQGDELGAQPLDLLRRRHREFQARVAKQTASGGELEAPPPAPQQRLALGVLKGKGKAAAAPVDRSGASHSALRGGMKLDSAQGDNRQKGGQFSVFVDENSGPALPPQSGEYAHIPSSKMHRENTQQPGAWKNVKLKQKSVPTMKISEVSSQANPAFNVFHDEAMEQPLKTPKKVNPEMNNQVLSAKKPSKAEDPFYSMQHQQQQQQDPNQRPMYCKAQVYNGCKEFSLEELRALQWRKEERARAKIREKEDLLEQKYREIQEREEQVQKQFQELQQKQRQLEMNKEKVAIYQETEMPMAQESIKPITRQNSGGRLQVPSVTSHHNQSQLTPTTDISQLTSDCSQFTGGSSSSKELQHYRPVQGRQPTPILHHTGPLLTSKDSTDSQPSFSAPGGGFGARSKAHDPARGRGGGDPPLDSGNSLNVTNQTPSFNQSLSSMPGSGNLMKKSSKITPDSSFMRTSLKGTPRSGSLTAPSPTVNTKEAMQVVMGMFNRTLEIDNNFGWAKNEQVDDFEADFAETNQEVPPVASTAAKFNIFTDSSEKQAPVIQKPDPPQQQATGPAFTIFSDDQGATNTGKTIPQQKATGPAFTIFSDKQATAQANKLSSSNILDKSENKRKFAEKPSSVREAGVAPPRVPLSGLGGGGGATQMDMGPSNVYHLPMQSEEPEVTEMVNAGNIFSKQTPETDMEYDFEGNELTFMPGFSSTINFTQAAQMASTPFNMLHEMNSLPAPPVSTIKPHPNPSDKDNSTTSGNPVSSVPENTMFEDMDRNGAASCSVETNHQVAETGNSQSEEGEGQDSSVQAQSRRSSAFAAKNANLSPIMEQSDEDAKSQGSSLGNNSTAHSNVFAANSTHHMSQSVHGKDNHTTRLSSVEEEPSKLTHMAMDASSHVDTTAPTANLEVSMKRACRQLEGAGNLTMHEIDITNYVPAETDERTERLLNMSVAIEDNDPFDENVIARFLSILKRPLESYSNYHQISTSMPDIQLGKAVALGDNIYNFDSIMGEGAYAKVYRANLMVETEYDLENEEKVIKVQNPPCPWEFYITSELHERINALQMPYDTRGSVMHVDHCYIYTDGSCLVSDLHKHGTLLELVNLHTRMNKKISQELVMLIGIEMLHLVEQLHKSHIIHGDIKPDNFLITGIPDITDNTNIDDLVGGRSKIIKLIDFGRSIDLNMYPQGTTFTTKVETSGFQCIEMKTDRPWTYQTDLFGMIGSLHVLLFRDYMKVYQENGRWRIVQAFKRYHLGMELWKRLFEECLNIPSCEELPDIVSIRKEFEVLLKAKLNHGRNFKTFVNSLLDLSIMYWEA